MDPRQVTYPVTVTLGIAALAARPANGPPRLGWRDAGAAATGFFGILGVASIVCAAKGITPGPMITAEYQRLARMLWQHCDRFVGYPGLPSLYAWTGKPMPGPANDRPGPLSVNSWSLLLTRSDQQAIVYEFARHPNGCVVYNPAAVHFGINPVWTRVGNRLFASYRNIS